MVDNRQKYRHILYIAFKRQQCLRKCASLLLRALPTLLLLHWATVIQLQDNINMELPFTPENLISFSLLQLFLIFYGNFLQ
jgi:hypothetical protein